MMECNNQFYYFTLLFLQYETDEMTSLEIELYDDSGNEAGLWNPGRTPDSNRTGMEDTLVVWNYFHPEKAPFNPANYKYPQNPLPSTPYCDSLNCTIPVHFM